jgi:outer membrane protein W
VWPIVSLGSDISLGYVAGNSGSFRIALNGVAPIYPFDVSYAVTGYLQDHDLDSGVAQFADGEVEKDIFLAITASAPPGTAPQPIDVALDDASINRGTRRALSIALVTANVPASVNVRGAQQSEGRPVFTRDANLPVTLHVDIADPNSADVHTVTWSGPPGAVFTVVNGELVLDPMSLLAGVHHFIVSVSDNGSPVSSTTLHFDVVLAATAPVLPTGSVGWADSALPANPDYSPPTRNVLPGQAQDLEHGLLEAEPGVQLALGSNVREQGVAQAQLAGAGLSSLAVDDVANSGGVFDFEILSLPRVGQSTSITIAQTTPIGAHAVYRLYDPVARTWRSFAAGPNDSISSAPSVGGACPPPGGAAYQPGLIAGNTCVRLTISDGGSNDADKGVNGSISNFGGVAAMNEVTVTATGRGRGGGAIDTLFLVFGLGVLALRRVSCKKLALLAACVLPAMASAGEGSGWYVGGQWGTARSDASEADMNRKLAEQGHDVTVDFEDTSRSAWKLLGGYQFSPYLGMQLGYTNLGEVDSRLSGNIIDVDQLLADVTRMHPRSADGIEAALTGRFPFGQRFAALGRVGLLRWESTYRAFNSQGEEFSRFEDSGTGLVLSAGVAWQLTSQWELSADFSRYDVDGEKIVVVAIGALWSFAPR